MSKKGSNRFFGRLFDDDDEAGDPGRELGDDAKTLEHLLTGARIEKVAVTTDGKLVLQLQLEPGELGDGE